MKLLLIATALVFATNAAFAHEHAAKKKTVEEAAAQAPAAQGHDKDHKHVEAAQDHEHDDAHHVVDDKKKKK